MFGMFGSKRRQQEQWSALGLNIVAVHRKMRDEVPAAAYLFARSFFNFRPLIFDNTTPLDQRIARIEAEIQSKASLNPNPTDALKMKNAMASIAITAQRFIVELLESQRRSNNAYHWLPAAFGEIAQSGAQYRSLNELDYSPPKNEGALRTLANGGHTCVADLIKAVRDEGAALRSEAPTTEGADVESENETVWNLLATFDLLDEGLSGRLAPYLRALEAVLSGIDFSVISARLASEQSSQRTKNRMHRLRQAVATISPNPLEAD
jgi:hypothetical protein